MGSFTEVERNILTYFADIIKAELGIIYDDRNFYQLKNRLDDLAFQFKFSNLQDLYQYALKGMDLKFKQLFLDTATNNETSFFRDARVFQKFENQVIAKGTELFNVPTVKIWSAASSTGQEPLSIAMLFQEYNSKLSTTQKIRYQITASDISERVLQKAKSGIYTALEVQRGLPQEYRERYFSETGDGNWKVSLELLSKIQYQKINLKQPFPFNSKFHIVFCRNVLIYQSAEAKKEILKRIVDCLEPEGFLVMGAGESALHLSDQVEQCSEDGAVLFRKKGKQIKQAA